MLGARTEANEVFHESYDRACGQAEDCPIFVVLADRLVVFRGKERRDRPLAVSAYHAIKTAAHVPIAVFAIASRRVDQPLDAATKTALGSLRGAGRPSSEGVEEAAARDMALAIDRANAYVDGLLAEEAVPSPGLRAFASSAGPILLRLTEHATRVQLASLDAAVETELASMRPDERFHLQAVVTGDHQARVRSLAMQYFQKRFGEKPGEENRVTYAEGVTDAEEAMALVGKRRFDRAIATAFFGDATRLQRDVLGDAAASLLGDLRPEPIIGPSTS
jgi:hypothetical protein